MLKKIISQALCMLTLACLAHTAHSQVAITLETNRKNYHQHEPAHLQLTLQNFSGTPLIFGQTSKLQGSITLEIQPPGNSLSNHAEFINVKLENLILRPGIAEKTHINLSKYFSLKYIGKYRIKAIVKHNQLQSDYESNKVNVNASKGVYVWSTSAGVPDVLGDNKDKKIQSVTYKIDSLFDGKELVYYLIIEDDTRIYTVSRIGNDLGTSHPQCKVDNLSRLHILIQASAKIYTYLTYETTGEKVKSEIYKKTTTSPQLSEDPNNGKIVVIGGKIAQKDVDYIQ